jgi:hypothetical protein
MFDVIFIVLALLFAKHLFVDFLFQTNEQVAQKGLYGKWKGIEHSLQHGIATTLILFIYIPFESAFLLGLADFIIHYHIDWLKMNINKWRNLSIDKSEFWFWLGADQFAHSLTYLWIVWTIV